jgi:hypothetical protein
MSEPGGPRLGRDTAAAIAVGVGVVVFGFRYLSNSGFSNDHFVHLARAQQMLLGGWPVRDFVDPGMPLMYAVSAAGMLLFGHALLAETIVVFVAFGVAAGLTFWLAWKAGVPAVWALVAVAFQVLMMPRSYSYPKLLIYAAAIAACWRLSDRPGPGRVLVLAVVVVLAFLFRHDHGVFVGVAGLAAIAAAPAKEGRPRRLRLAAVYGGLCLLLLLPWAIYVQASLGLGRYIRSAVEFSRAEAAQTRLAWPRFTIDPGAGLWLVSTPPAAPPPVVYVRWRPGLSDAAIVERERALGLARIELHEGRTWRYHPDVTRLDDIVADPAVEDTNHLDEARPHWWHALSPSRWRLIGPGSGWHVEENSRSFLFYLFLALPVGFLAVAALAPPDRRARILVVALLALMVTAAFLRDPLEARLPDVVMPQTLLLAWLVAWGFRRGATRRVLAPLLAGVTIILTATAVNAVGNVPEQFNRIGTLNPVSLVRAASDSTTRLRAEFEPRLMPSRASAELIPLFEYLQECTEPADRFVYVGFGPELYFYAGRGFGGGHPVWLFTFYVSDEEQRLTRSRWAAERVPVLIVPEDEVEGFHRIFPIVAAYADERYQRIGEVSLGDGRGIVFADTSIPSRRIHPGLGWPCFT